MIRERSRSRFGYAAGTMSHAATTCEQGIAYLKAKLDEADPDPGTRVSLDRDQSPVLRDLGNRLLVAYVLAWLLMPEA